MDRHRTVDNDRWRSYRGTKTVVQMNGQTDIKQIQMDKLRQTGWGRQTDGEIARERDREGPTTERYRDQAGHTKRASRRETRERRTSRTSPS